MKKVSKLDKQMIKLYYGNMKNYNDTKTENENFDNKKIEIDNRIKETNILMNSQLFNSLRLEKELNQLNQYKKDIKNTLVKLYSDNYNKWLIVYDLLNGSYYEIKTNLNREKISTHNIKEVITECNKIHDIFNLNVTMELIQYSC